MARIRIAKATSGAAFLNKKKETEARIASAQDAADAGGPTQLVSNSEDIFELQHHHLLQCLERTTVSLRIYLFDGVSYDVYLVS